MAYQLSDTRQVVERSLHAALLSAGVLAGYCVNIKALTQHTINAINQGAKQFTVNGVNLTNTYLPQRKFDVVESPGVNNGTYTVVSSTYAGGNTTITVKEVIPSSTVNGKLSIYTYYDDSIGVASFNAAQEAIIADKGFVVDIFGVGASYAKYQKKIPRIVIIPNQSLPGALGGNGDPIFKPNGDPLAPDSYTKEVTPPQTVDFTYDFHLVASTAEQSRILNGILAAGIPQRGYVPLLTDPTVRFFVDFFSYRNIPRPGDNIMEDVFMYRASDMYETTNDVSPESIIPITEITKETKIGKATDPNNALDAGTDTTVE